MLGHCFEYFAISSSYSSQPGGPLLVGDVRWRSTVITCSGALFTWGWSGCWVWWGTHATGVQEDSGDSDEQVGCYFRHTMFPQLVLS